jgi:hypothetical protein
MSLMNKLNAPVSMPLTTGIYDVIIMEWAEGTVTSKATATKAPEVFDVVYLTITPVTRMDKAYRVTLFEKDLDKFSERLQAKLLLEGLTVIQLLEHAISNKVPFTSTYEVKAKETGCYDHWLVGYVRTATTTTTTATTTTAAPARTPRR